MPFTIQKNKKEFCVFKADDDGKPMGTSLGCHDSRKDAVAQIGAIESKEKQGKKSGDSYNFYFQTATTNDQYPQTVTTTWPETGTYTWVSIDGDKTFVEIDQEEDMSEEDVTKAGMKFDSEEKAKEAAEELGCSGAHEMPDGSYMPCSKHEDFVELSGKKSISVDAEELVKYLDDENDWTLEVTSDLIKSFINNKQIVDEEPNESKVDSRFAVKALGENRIGAYGVLWGSAEEQDLHEEHFTNKTKDLTAIFDAMGKIPLVVHHAADDKVKTFVYGEVDVMELDDIGLWYEAKIKEFETYRRYVQPFLNDKKLFSSSGTLPAAKRVTKSGEIVRWPIAEMTTTWMPAEYRMLERPVHEIKSVYEEMGLDCDLSEYDNDKEPDTKGAEKARLKAMVDYHLSELGLLEIEI